MANTYVKYIGTQIGHQETLPAGTTGISGIVTVNPGDIVSLDSKAATSLVANESSSWAAVTDPSQSSRHITISATTAPTAAAATNAGTSPPAPVIAGNDTKGNVTFGTGTSASAGAQATVTYNTAYAVGTTPRPIICAANAATATLSPYITSSSQTGFSIALAGSVASSQANTVYSVNYIVIG